MSNYLIFLLIFINYDYVLTYYTYTANQNSPNNIEKFPNSNIEDLSKICDEMKECKGFDTQGYLKSSSSPLARDPYSSFYTKTSGHGPNPLPTNLWPLPQQYTYGFTTINLATPFSFKANDSSDILSKAFTRYHSLIFSKGDKTRYQDGAISQVLVNVGSIDSTLQLETDQSYNLEIEKSGIIIEAKTIYGAIYGLETLSQLIEYQFDQKVYMIKNGPWNIVDYPKFPHRGLLIDTSRHFLPVKTIKKIIDSLSYAKMNVLHWHIVDCQSFPVESHSWPNLWLGSWSEQERYTQEQLIDVVNYAKERGVRVMPEFDGPGHMWSWGVGYPDLLPQGYEENSNCSSKCPVNPCDVPIDPSSPICFQVLDDFLEEMTGGSAGKGIFFESFLHMGGDEVEYACWSQSTRIQNFMKQNHLSNYNELYEYFITKAHQIAKSYGRSPVNWEEVFNHFGKRLSPETIIHVWLDHATLSKVVSAGYRGILSNYNDWYLDQLNTPWTAFYLNDPLVNISKNFNLVLGGETCMWGEVVDPSDIFTRVWPKTAAVAEVLWNYNVVRSPNSVDLAVPRLHHFRCHLLDRDIDSAPLNSYAPTQPGSCYTS